MKRSATKTSARRRLAAFALAGLLALGATLSGGGCTEETGGNEVEVAFQALVGAMQRKDPDALYGLTTNRVRTFLDALARDLGEAERLVRAYFPEWQQETFAQQLALSRLGGTKDGRELFGRLVDFGKAREGDAVADGLEHEPALIQNDTATVRTAAGEVFHFVREDGEWRTTVYDAVTTLPILDTLQKNIQTLRENVRRLRELYATANDPRAPEGAFNQLRDALAKDDGKVVFTLVDEEGRKTFGKLREALVALKGLPEPDRVARLAAADVGALELADATTSDRRLAEALTSAGRLRDVIGLDAGSAVHVVRIASRSEAVVVTTEAEEFAFVLEADGLWHLADVAPLLSEALLGPLTAAADKKSAPGQAARSPR